MKNTKNTISSLMKNAAILISFAAFSLLIACADPMAGEDVVGEGDGLITVTIGGGNARAAVAWAETLDSKNLIHKITVSGGKGGPYVKDIPAGGGAVNFSVTPGLWTILVQAYYLGDLVAEGSETKQIKQGNNGYISIKMQEPSNFPRYTVSFDSNGGSALPSQTVKKYNRAVRPASDPTNSNQYFIDWYTESACITQYSFSAAVTGNITLYAGWSASTPYTVTFDKNGGDTDASPTSRNAASGGTVALPTPPTRTGYVFVEWNTVQGGGTGTAFTASTPVTADIIVYAKWTPAYTVTFNKNNSDAGSTEASPASISVASGGTVTLPTAPTRTGYTFASWNTVSGGSGTAFTASTPVIADITVYAQWTKNLTLTVPTQPVSVSPIGSQFTVTVDGFNNNGDAASVGLTMGTSIGPLFDKYSAADGIVSTTSGIKKTFTVLIDTATSLTGNSTTITITAPAGYAYNDGPKTVNFAVKDGASAANAIPVYKSNIKTFDTYASTTGLAKFYKLEEDIVAADLPANWTAIGTSASPFSGTFDGQDHTITGLSIAAGAADYQGLFGYIKGAYIKNVGLVSAKIVTTGQYVGGIAGYNDGGVVEKCYVTTGAANSITGGDSTGGVVGSNSYFTNSDYYPQHGRESNCYFIGTVAGTTRVGGIVGYNYYGEVKKCYSTGSVSGTQYVGGVAGHNNGEVLSGGLAIPNPPPHSSVENCYSTANVTGTGDYVGGIVGGMNGYVSYCYATGNVSGTDMVGGVAGNNASGRITYCVALNGSLTAGSNYGRVVGLSTTIVGCESAVLTKNYGNSGMTGGSWNNVGPTDLDGDNVSSGAGGYGDQSWWTTTAQWTFGTDWEWGTNLPKLAGVGGQ